MSQKSDSGRNLPLAKAMRWVSVITNISLTMALPPLAGLGIDHWLNAKPVFLVIFAMIGFGMGIYELLRLATSLSQKP